MPNTANGVPYPAGTTTLATWAATMLALAQFLDDRLNTRAKVYAGAAQTCTTGVAANLAMNTEDTDPKLMHDTVTNNSRVKAVTAGRHEVKGSVSWVSNAAGFRQLAIIKNGATVIAVNKIPPVNGSGTVQQVQASVYLAVNDYVELQVVQTSGGNLDTVAGSSNTWLDVTLTGNA